MIDVKAKINYLMETNKWTEYELSRRSGVHRSTIASIARGKNSPRVDTLNDICEAFGISISEFFKEESTDIDNIISKYRHLDERQKLLIRNIFELLDN